MIPRTRLEAPLSQKLSLSRGSRRFRKVSLRPKRIPQRSPSLHREPLQRILPEGSRAQMGRGQGSGLPRKPTMMLPPGRRSRRPSRGPRQLLQLRLRPQTAISRVIPEQRSGAQQ